jgi:hypothetical protein
MILTQHLLAGYKFERSVTSETAKESDLLLGRQRVEGPDLSFDRICLRAISVAPGHFSQAMPRNAQQPRELRDR